MRKIRTPEIDQEIFVIVKGSRTQYDYLHRYNETTGKPFIVKKRWPYCIEAVDDEGHEWRFPAADFSFVKPYKTS